jgi:hypothetical protein
LKVSFPHHAAGRVEIDATWPCIKIYGSTPDRPLRRGSIDWFSPQPVETGASVDYL